MKAYIIGNGHSLRRTPLHWLNDEVTYAVGRINLIFNQTEWRPKNYVRIEEEGIDSDAWAEDMKAILPTGCACYLTVGFIGHHRNYKLRHYEDRKTRIEWVKTCDGKHTPGWHLPELCSYGGSLFTAIQIAIKEGYDPLYLVGCDLGREHFTEDYQKGVQREDASALWLDAHVIALRDSPVKIYNATIGGSLEVYERSSL